MHQPLIKAMRGIPLHMYVSGYMVPDPEALNAYQSDGIDRLTVSMQAEQEVYMLQHPEIATMSKISVSKLTHHLNKCDLVKNLCHQFIKPVDELDKEIRKYLELPPEGPYRKENADILEINESNFYADLFQIVTKHYPKDDWAVSSQGAETPFTPSSSFISEITSVSTPLTPEPEPEHEPTMAEIIFKMISNTLDKATLLKVTEDDVKYDMAYVELMNAVETAMEIPVIEIRSDIAELYRSAYKSFEYYVIEKQKLEAAIAWEKRMRKKLKRLLRRQNNFKGYETPPSSSNISSHPSYKVPPPRPCVCHPQWTYNRYPKDRYGIYMPSGYQFDNNTTTAAPVVSEVHIQDAGDISADDDKAVTATK